MSLAKGSKNEDAPIASNTLQETSRDRVARFIRLARGSKIDYIPITPI